MVAVFIPGFLRVGAELDRWKQLLPGDVVTLDLPGHGPPPLPVHDLPALIAYFAARIPRDALVVGESLGGLIALGLAGRGLRCVAFDPPLSPDKLWFMRENAPIERAARNGRPWLREFAGSIFGIMPDGGAEPRDHWRLLDALVAPVDIVAASEPTWPERTLGGVVPSVIDDIDAARLAAHPMVRFQRVAGGHALLTQSVAASRAILLPLLP